MRLRTLGSGLCLLVLCASVSAQDAVTIGVSLAQSPPGSVVQGTQIRDGIEIIKDIVNKSGGVLGRQIQDQRELALGRPPGRDRECFGQPGPGLVRGAVLLGRPLDVCPQSDDLSAELCAQVQGVPQPVQGRIPAAGTGLAKADRQRE